MSSLKQYYGVPRDSADIVIFPKAATAVEAYRDYLETALPQNGPSSEVPLEFSLFLTQQELHGIQKQLQQRLEETGELPETVHICFRTLSAIFDKLSFHQHVLAGPVSVASLKSVLDPAENVAVV